MMSIRHRDSLLNVVKSTKPRLRTRFLFIFKLFLKKCLKYILMGVLYNCSEGGTQGETKMKNTVKKDYIIKKIKEESVFHNLQPKVINVTDESINVAMIHKTTGMVEYVLRFCNDWVIKYDCFDHYTTAYELAIFERIARESANLKEDAE